MSYPFPGMNPWLEDTKIWRNVHLSLINALRDVLASQLEPRYFVDIETHTYLAYPPTLPVQTHDREAYSIATPTVIDLPLPEYYEEPYIEVRLADSGKIVTVIEILSYTNKPGGDERHSYIKVREAESRDAHLIAVDLLRGYAPLPFAEHLATDYLIFVRRSDLNRKAHLFAFNLRDPIPLFPLPLLPDDQEPLVDLGTLLHEVYDRARYRLVIDYNKPPTPQLEPADAAWAADWLAAAQ